MTMDQLASSSLFPAFTPAPSLVGGLMIAGSVVGFLSNTGNVLGISGFLHRAVRSLAGLHEKSDNLQQQTNRAISFALTGGLIFGGLVLRSLRFKLEENLGIRLFDVDIGHDYPINISAVNAIAGLAVGFGTSLGSGCTSGHMLCGVSRLSPRSIVATATFFSVGVITHLLASDGSHSATNPLLEQNSTFSTPATTVLTLIALQLPAFIYSVVVPTIAKKTADAETKPKVFYYPSILAAFSAGVHFAFGLGLAGMLRPSKVLGFLSISPSRISNGTWDPSMLMIVVGGILPISLHYFYRIEPSIRASDFQPTLGPNCTWNIPTLTKITPQLIVGSAIFGIGWGLTGGCPGPVLVNFGASSDVKNVGISLGSIAVGGLVAQMFQGWMTKILT